MTSPEARGLELSDRLRDLTAATSPEVAGALQARLDRAQSELVALWVREFGSEQDGPGDPQSLVRFARTARARLESALNPDVVDGAALTVAVEDAYRTGTAHASGGPSGALAGSVPDNWEAPDLAAVVAEQRARALSALDDTAVEAIGFPTVMVAVARGRRAVSRIEAAVAAEITGAASEGVRQVADARGFAVVWIAEPDGCLHCLAYAGRISTDGTFPERLTFGDRPLVQPDTLTGPGLHPRCRCTLELIDPGDTAVSEALRREAMRSVLRGWTHESESTPARLRAAERLLAAGSGLPKSVETKARKSVRDGEFPDDRPPAPERDAPIARDAVTYSPEPVDDDNAEPVETVSGDSREGVERVSPATLTDDELDQAMQDAIAAENYELLEELSQEADLRDAEAQAPTAAVEAFAQTADDDAWADAWGAADDVVDDVDPEDERRYQEMERLLAAGVDEGAAYAEVFGVAADRYRRDEAIQRLRANGYRGDGFDALARRAYADLIAENINKAEEVTNGYFLNGVGKRAKIDPHSLFTGPLSRAAKYASDELKDWFEANGRVTFDEFAESLLGRDASVTGSGRFINR